MKLKDLLKKFGGGASVSVCDVSRNYCKKASYDYYDLPNWARAKAGLREFISTDNPPSRINMHHPGELVVRC